jgi:uncharacterized protein (TIRG00374 family)
MNIDLELQNPMRRVTLILLIIASIFFFLMLREIGWSKLGHYLQQVGYYWPLILVPYAFINFLGAISWKVLLVSRDTCPGIVRLFFLRLAGESLNQLTPTASLGGEPFKALRLHSDGVSWQEGTASLVIQKGMMMLSLVVYIFMSLALAPFVFLSKLPHMGLLSLGAVLLAGAGIAFIIVQRSNPCASVIRHLKKLSLCPAVLIRKEAELATLDSYLAEFYRKHPDRCIAAFVLLVLGWLVHAFEAYMIFSLLGHPISWGTALCLDGLSMLFTGLGFMIPVSLGVQDGGYILLALGLKLGAPLGAAFTIIRRIREAFWLLLGLLVVSRER